MILDFQRRTPGGLAFSEEKARPGATETPQATKGRHFGDRPDKVRGGEDGKPFSPRRETKPWRGGNPGEDRARPLGTPMVRHRTNPMAVATDFRRE
jgi:hypothetical protein